MNPRLVATLALLVALAVAIEPAYSGSEDQKTREASDKVVAQAEALVMQAGRQDPADSALMRKAIEVLRHAIQIDPDNDSAWVDLGFCYGFLRDSEAAIDAYVKAAEINPSGANFKELADIFLRVGDPDHALMAANAGLAKDPGNARLYNAKGMALNDLKRIDEAAEAFEKAIKLDPKLAVARANLDALNSGATGRGSVAKHSRGD